MRKKKRSDPKEEALQEHGTLNPRPEEVGDPLFQEEAFFDPRDLLQVKYEMLRRVRVDKHAVSQAASAHGLSRPTFYQAQLAFEKEGLWGLLPEKRGPRGGHKLTEEVVEALRKQRELDETLSVKDLARIAEEHFGLKVHPRSIDRVLKAQKKKRR